MYLSLCLGKMCITPVLAPQTLTCTMAIIARVTNNSHFGGGISSTFNSSVAVQVGCVLQPRIMVQYKILVIHDLYLYILTLGNEV